MQEIKSFCKIKSRSLPLKNRHGTKYQKLYYRNRIIVGGWHDVDGGNLSLFRTMKTSNRQALVMLSLATFKH